MWPNMVITITTCFIGRRNSNIHLKKKKKAKQEQVETNPRGHTLTRSPQLFSLREDLCGSGSVLKVIVSAYVCVKERVPFIESINTRLTFYRTIYLAEYTMNYIWINIGIYWYHVCYQSYPHFGYIILLDI